MLFVTTMGDAELVLLLEQFDYAHLVLMAGSPHETFQTNKNALFARKERFYH